MDGEDFPPLKKNELSTAEAPVGRAHCIFCRQKVLLSRGAGWRRGYAGGGKIIYYNQNLTCSHGRRHRRAENVSLPSSELHNRREDFSVK